MVNAVPSAIVTMIQFTTITAALYVRYPRGSSS